MCINKSDYCLLVNAEATTITTTTFATKCAYSRCIDNNSTKSRWMEWSEKKDRSQPASPGGRLCCCRWIIQLFMYLNIYWLFSICFLPIQSHSLLGRCCCAIDRDRDRLKDFYIQQSIAVQQSTWICGRHISHAIHKLHHQFQYHRRHDNERNTFAFYRETRNGNNN